MKSKYLTKEISVLANKDAKNVTVSPVRLVEVQKEIEPCKGNCLKCKCINK